MYAKREKDRETEENKRINGKRSMDVTLTVAIVAYTYVCKLEKSESQTINDNERTNVYKT